MAVYSTPETHAANPPSTWSIRKACERRWQLVDANGDVLDSFDTKRDAAIAAESGTLRRMYDQEGRWYAGETPAGHRSWAECKAERERIAKRWNTLQPA